MPGAGHADPEAEGRQAQEVRVAVVVQRVAQPDEREVEGIGGDADHGDGFVEERAQGQEPEQESGQADRGRDQSPATQVDESPLPEEPVEQIGHRRVMGVVLVARRRPGRLRDQHRQEVEGREAEVVEVPARDDDVAVRVRVPSLLERASGPGEKEHSRHHHRDQRERDRTPCSPVCDGHERALYSIRGSPLRLRSPARGRPASDGSLSSVADAAGPGRQAHPQPIIPRFRPTLRRCGHGSPPIRAPVPESRSGSHAGRRRRPGSTDRTSMAHDRPDSCTKRWWLWWS